MSNHKYLNFDQYNGSLGGLQEYPAGPYDVASPGGMSSMNHHWTNGFYGKPERTYDVYAGTGDRYISGEYGNLYTPNSHASINDIYGGPQTAQTDYQTLSGDPYYWNNSSSSLGDNQYSGQSTPQYPGQSNNQTATQKKNSISAMGGKKIEGYEPVDGSFELIEPEITVKGSNSQTSKIKLLPNPVPLPPIPDQSYYTTDYTPVYNTGLSVIIALIIYIMCSLWWENIKKCLYALHGGKGITLNRMLIYAIITTMFLFLVLYVSGSTLKLPSS